MKKRWVALFMAAVLAVGTLAGCGGEKKGNKTDEGEGNTLSVWCWDPTFNINAMKEAEKEYQKDHPEFSLEITEISAGDIMQKLATSTSAGNTADVLPDIILFDDALVSQAVVSYPDVFMDLTDSGIDFSQFSQGKVANSVVDGKNYGIPFDSGAAIAAYRTDILKEAGYTIDDFTDITWSEFIEKGKVVKAKTGKALINGSGAYNQLTIMLTSCGGSYFDSKGNISLANNDKVKKISEIYLEMKKEGIFQEETGWDTYVGNINNGNVAGAMNGCWIMSSITAAEDQSGLWAITNLPSVEGVEGATNYSSQGGSSWVITEECENRELAIDFFASTFAGSTEFYDAILPSSAISTWIPAGESTKYEEPSAFFSNQPVYRLILDFTAKIPAVTTNAYDSSARSALVNALTNVEFSGGDLEEELKAAEKTVAFEMDRTEN